MKFTLFTTITLAASVLAAPSMEKVKAVKRTGTPLSCAGGQGTLACCQDTKVVPTSSLDSKTASFLGSLLHLVPAILPILIEAVTVTSQCDSLFAEFQTCSFQKICCVSSGGTGSSDHDSFISLLSDNDVALCPGVAI